jgi:hypothetical protein
MNAIDKHSISFLIVRVVCGGIIFAHGLKNFLGGLMDLDSTPPCNISRKP